jgi:thioredoxin 1
MKKAIRFSAPWCGPCKTYEPMWNEVSKSREDWTFEVVDVDENSEAGSKYGIRSIPSTVLESSDGSVLAKYTGVISVKDLNSKLDEWSEK